MTTQTTGEQIAAFEAKKRAAEDAAVAIVQKSIEEGRTLDSTEDEQRKSYLAECKSIDGHLIVLRQHEQLMIQRAAPVAPDAGMNSVDIGSPAQIRVRSNVAPGIRFTRFALAMAHAKGNVMQAHEIAKQRFKDTPEVINALQAAIGLGGTRDLHEKAAVAFATTTDASFVGPLVQYNDMERDFIELLRPATIIGRMTQLHRVPFMSRLGRQLTGVSGSFVGEGAPKPVNKQTYDNVTLGPAKAAVIVVLSDEAVRFSSPNAETKARDDMVKGIATYLDKRFMDPAYSGIVGVSPASITNAATRVQASGTSIAAIDTDVRTAMETAFTTNLDPSSAVWVMSASTALRLSMKRNTNDEYVFPTLSIKGGTWHGLPVIVSNAMIASGSPSERQIALVTQSEVLMADDGGVSLDMSMEASVQMDDAPSGGAQSLLSLWQNNLVGIRAERYINWAPARPSSLGVVLIENTNY